MLHDELQQVEDFVLNSRFQRWIQNPTPQEDHFWEQWLLLNPEKREKAEQARAIVLALSGMQQQEISDTEVASEIQSVLARVEESSSADKRENPAAGMQWLNARLLRVAASIALVLAALGWYGWHELYQQPPSSKLTHNGKVESQFIERVNLTQSPLLVNLPDRSTVLLGKRAKVRYDSSFNGTKREVFLEGDAFF